MPEGHSCTDGQFGLLALQKADATTGLDSCKHCLELAASRHFS
jgi:hypothetical protein